MTLHRLLQITKVNDANYINEDINIEPVDADVVIVDEVSMIDLALKIGRASCRERVFILV